MENQLRAGNGSATQVITPPTTLYYWMHLTGVVQETEKPVSKDVHERLSLLFEEMRASPLVSQEMREKIDAAETQFKNEHPNDFSTVENDIIREKASNDLCFFLNDVIHPAIESYSNDLHAQDSLLLFEDELRKILALTVPKNENVDVFIEDYLEYANDGMKERVEQEFQAIESVLQKRIQKLYKKVNKLNQKLMDQPTIQKQCLIESNNQLMNEVVELDKRLAPLTGKVSQHSKQMQDISKKVQELLEKMSHQEQESRSILESARQLAQKKMV
jgi:methyl-accepting chemotaxis protein